jgi:phosphoribosylamine--glycine ligase
LEFNARFGDPETQPLLMRLQSDLLDLIEAVVDERLVELDPTTIHWDPRPAVSVVLTSDGYPGKPITGRPIFGLEQVLSMPNIKVFHSGTKLDGTHVQTDGGRVLSVTALGDNLQDARDHAYAAIKKISFPGMHYRTDIADRALRTKNKQNDIKENVTQKQM